MDGMIVLLPAIVKSSILDGRRMIEVEASTQEVDLDGDVILQQALLKSAADFVAKGHFDLDHLSEFGQRLGIPNPSSYVIGRPTEVRDIGGGRTSVVGEISKSKDGTVDPAVSKADEFWLSLQNEPPVQWYSSVYGFPGQDMEVVKNKPNSFGARRYIIKSMSWRSLAFTRTPKNTALQNAARIVSAKSYMSALSAGRNPYEEIPPIVNGMHELTLHKSCAVCNCGRTPSTISYREHFEKCAGMLPNAADIYANALMNWVNQDRVLRRKSVAN